MVDSFRTPPIDTYIELVSSGDLLKDPLQEAAMHHLNRLYLDIQSGSGFFGYFSMSRLLKLVGLSKGKNPLEVEVDLEKNIPAKWKKHAHHWLILHGRYICKARKPMCFDCQIRNECKFYKKQFKNH